MVDSRQSGTSKRGFASMDAAKQREIARKGGESVPAEKRSFSQNHELAAQAGRKGGQASQGSRNSSMRSASRARGVGFESESTTSIDRSMNPEHSSDRGMSSDRASERMDSSQEPSSER